MNTIVISLGGEDFSVEYYESDVGTYYIYSIQNMGGKEIELTDELEQEIFDKFCQLKKND